MMNPAKFIILSVLTMSVTWCHAQTAGKMKDPRDGQKYKTITYTLDDSLKMAHMTWMAQNLNYQAEGSWAYENDETLRKKYGLLYTWNAAMKACPAGWHLPSEEEWIILINHFEGEEVAGDALKSIKDWEEEGNGSNSSGFNALPGGYREYIGSYKYLGIYGQWWCSKEHEAHAWYFFMVNSGSMVKMEYSDKPLGFSVRCVKNADVQ